MSRGEENSRRRFLGRLSIGLAAFWSLLGGVLGGVAVLGPVGRATATRRVSMGDVSQFGPEYQAVRVSVPSSHGWRAHEITSTVFVRTGEDGALQALSGKCTHLGCTVRWMADEGEFHCPCHGGKFGADGTQIAGPPPDPLVSLTTEVNGAEAFVELG